MSWTGILVLSAGAYLFKVVGLFAGDRFSRPLAPVASLLPAALFSALIVVMSVTEGDTLIVDARLMGVAVGVLAVWRRAPFIVVVAAAMAATAGLRLLA
ncbi:MAG: AzlD domain-containing protein [Acidimicrobiales bacterium]|nr:AzlD domain-containing protein [Acidimicrobiales bacterium]